MTRYRRSELGKEKHEKFQEVTNPDEIGNVAQDKAYLNSKRSKAFSNMTIQELRKYATIAWTGVKIRSKIDKRLAELEVQLGYANQHNDVDAINGIVGDIRLLNEMMEVE